MSNEITIRIKRSEWSLTHEARLFKEKSLFHALITRMMDLPFIHLICLQYLHSILLKFIFFNIMYIIGESTSILIDYMSLGSNSTHGRQLNLLCFRYYGKRKRHVVPLSTLNMSRLISVILKLRIRSLEVSKNNTYTNMDIFIKIIL